VNIVRTANGRCGCWSKTDPLGPHINIMEGDFLKDPLPKGHDAVLLAHVVHVLVPERGRRLPKVRACSLSISGRTLRTRSR